MERRHSRRVKNKRAKTRNRKKIEMEVGIDKVIKLDFVPYHRVDIGNSKLLDYSIVINSKKNKHELILKGLRPGQSSVIVRDKDGDVKLALRVYVTQIKR